MDLILNTPYESFEKASKAVLSYLHKRLGFGLWMVTRTEGEEWIVLQSEDQGYNVKPGDVFKWTDSFCSEMVKGNGPCIAPNSDSIPVYKNAPIGQQVPIKAYIGYPLTKENGELFGTLCAIDPETQPESINNDLDLIEILARLLSSVLEQEMKQEEHLREKEKLEALALTDEMTSLYNKRAWDQFINNEEARCKRYGHPVSVLVIDLNDLKQTNDSLGHLEGDALIKKASAAIKQAVRDHDIVARIGGDEFGVLSIECNKYSAKKLKERIVKYLEDNHISAAVGLATRSHNLGLIQAFEEADQLMYDHKKQQKEK